MRYFATVFIQYVAMQCDTQNIVNFADNFIYLEIIQLTI
jgi:hypothetical protein